MKVLFLSVLFSGCAPTQPVDVLREYARTLQATRSAYYATCVQAPQTPLSEGHCIVADAHLEAATELFSDLRGK